MQRAAAILVRFGLFFTVYALVTVWQGEGPGRALAEALVASGLFVLLYGLAERWLPALRNGRRGRLWR